MTGSKVSLGKGDQIANKDHIVAATEIKLKEIRQNNIIYGVVFIFIEIILGLIVWAEPHPFHYFCTITDTCESAFVFLRGFPPFYIVVCVANLLFSMILLIVFILSFGNQADLEAYSIKSIRPIELIITFLLSSNGTIIYMFSVLYQWTGIYADTIIVCKDGQCTLSPIATKNIWECIYFSVITITTVGYGDYHPLNSPLSHLIAGAEAISGYILLGVLVSSLSTMARADSTIAHFFRGIVSRRRASKQNKKSLRALRKKDD